MDQRTGTAATVSIIAAIGSYVATCTGHPIWGLVAAIVAIPAGAIGLLMSASPRIKGGIMSIVAMVLGVVGLVVAILGMAGAIVF